MNRQQAINYLLSSGFSEEQIDTIEQAFKQEPTTKNNLGVDCISRDEVCRYVAEFVNHEFSTREEEELIDNIITGIEHMISATPQEQESCDKCEVGNPCLYCKHEFKPQESEAENGTQS